MTTKQLNNRRYYLHRRVRASFRLNTARKTIYATAEQMGGVNERNKAYINDLQNRFGYAVQIELV